MYGDSEIYFSEIKDSGVVPWLLRHGVHRQSGKESEWITSRYAQLGDRARRVVALGQSSYWGWIIFAPNDHADLWHCAWQSNRA